MTSADPLEPYDKELAHQLKLALPDDHARDMLSGALQVLPLRENRLRLSQFAAPMREMLDTILRDLAPEEEVRRCSWFVQDKDYKGITRLQRAIYACQGGLSDAKLKELGFDEEMHADLISTFKELNSKIHVQPGNLVKEEAEVPAFVNPVLTVYLEFFTTFYGVRDSIIELVADQVPNEAVDSLLEETITDIDLIATHHSIDFIEIETVTISRITATEILWRVEGYLQVHLQWGSNSDQVNDMGATRDESFPFKTIVASTVEDIKTLHEREDLRQINLKSWFGDDWNKYDGMEEGTEL